MERARGCRLEDRGDWIDLEDENEGKQVEYLGLQSTQTYPCGLRIYSVLLDQTFLSGLMENYI
jgi:hypothetical protein